jgi:hypothetical protein
MRVRSSDSENHLGRTIAALVGAGPAAIAAGIGLVYALPIRFEWRLAIGAHVLVPAWIALCWWALLAQSGRRAWLRLSGVFATSVVVALLGHWAGRGAP